MTIKELAQNWIEHADTTPRLISTDTAAEYISWMDPDTDLPEDLTPESFAAAWNDIIGPALVSVDNGRSYMTAPETIEYLSLCADPGAVWDTLVNFMDDETREQVCSELAPCSDAEFLTRYLELAPCDLVIG